MKQLSLFPSEQKFPYKYCPNFIKQTEANFLFDIFKTLQWKQYKNKYAVNPRLESFYGRGNYNYGSGTLKALPWTKDLKDLCSKVISETGYMFDSVFCNLYRDGNDSVGWHADRYSIMGDSPAIASVSFGETRLFQVKDLRNNKKHEIWLEHGSLLLMLPGMQDNYKHCIPKTKIKCGERINLTFRPVNC